MRSLSSWSTLQRVAAPHIGTRTGLFPNGRQMIYLTTTRPARDGGWLLILEEKELIHVETVGGSRNHIHVQQMM
jgi:hypothetical protein